MEVKKRKEKALEIAQQLSDATKRMTELETELRSAQHRVSKVEEGNNAELIELKQQVRGNSELFPTPLSSLFLSVSLPLCFFLFHFHFCF